MKTTAHEIVHAARAGIVLAGMKPDGSPLWSGSGLDLALFNLLEQSYLLLRNIEELKRPYAGLLV